MIRRRSGLVLCRRYAPAVRTWVARKTTVHLHISLGVDPMAAYRHVADQQDLFDAVAVRLFAAAADATTGTDHFDIGRSAMLDGFARYLAGVELDSPTADSPETGSHPSDNRQRARRWRVRPADNASSTDGGRLIGARDHTLRQMRPAARFGLETKSSPLGQGAALHCPFSRRRCSGRRPSPHRWSGPHRWPRPIPRYRPLPGCRRCRHHAYHPYPSCR